MRSPEAYRRVPVRLPGDPPMNPRLIPWCLAATGFLAALCVFAWQGKVGDPGQRVQPQITAAVPLPTLPAIDHHELASSQVPVPSGVPGDEPEDAPTTQTLPLPPATEPPSDPAVQPVPDDQPTVDDLPAQRKPPDSPEGE